MTTRPDQVLIQLDRDPGTGRVRRRVRRLPRGTRLAGAAAPWVWTRLQATRRSLTAGG